MLVPHVFVHQAELQADIAKASGMLGPEVVSFTYRLDTDSTGDPAIYFHIVLQDWATTEDLIGDVTGRIATTFFNEAHLPDKWGLQPYFNWGKASAQPRPSERRTA